MSDPDFLGKGVKFPPQLAGAGIETVLACSEGEDSIRDSIVMILSTRKGERLMRPDFGCNLHDYIFEQNNVTTRTRIGHEAEEALKKFEPRIKIDSLSVSSEPEEAHILYFNISYTVRSNNTRHNMVFPFYLEKE